jgi:hypothetical protein
MKEILQQTVSRRKVLQLLVVKGAATLLGKKITNALAPVEALAAASQAKSATRQEGTPLTPMAAGGANNLAPASADILGATRTELPPFSTLVVENTLHSNIGTDGSVVALIPPTGEGHVSDKGKLFDNGAQIPLTEVDARNVRRLDVSANSPTTVLLEMDAGEADKSGVAILDTSGPRLEEVSPAEGAQYEGWVTTKPLNGDPLSVAGCTTYASGDTTRLQMGMYSRMGDGPYAFADVSVTGEAQGRAGCAMTTLTDPNSGNPFYLAMATDSSGQLLGSLASWAITAPIGGGAPDTLNLRGDQVVLPRIPGLAAISDPVDPYSALLYSQALRNSSIVRLTLGADGYTFGEIGIPESGPSKRQVSGLSAVVGELQVITVDGEPVLGTGLSRDTAFSTLMEDSTGQLFLRLIVVGSGTRVDVSDIELPGFRQGVGREFTEVGLTGDKNGAIRVVKNSDGTLQLASGGGVVFEGPTTATTDGIYRSVVAHNAYMPLVQVQASH